MKIPPMLIRKYATSKENFNKVIASFHHCFTTAASILAQLVFINWLNMVQGGDSMTDLGILARR